jgi:hypothetical protein
LILISAALNAEIARVKAELRDLQIYCLPANPMVQIEFHGLFTMVDGKVLNALTRNANSQACPICHARPNQMCNPSCPLGDEFTPKEGSLDYGVAPLHFGIRTFEFFLHVGFNQDFQQWQARGETNKALKARRKFQIQADLERQLAIKVCHVRPGGGTSNTGNVARRALNAPDVLGRACGVPAEMVKLARTLWILLACPYEVDPEKFQALCKRFRELYFNPANNVSWYKLPPTVHKVVVHGAAILRKSPVPVGLLSEECSESNNKEIAREKVYGNKTT